VGGRKRVSTEIRALIFRMAAENPTWGAPRIHGELLKLGFDLSEPTVSRWLRSVSRTPDPVKRWLTFLWNHRDAITAMDFFTVPTITFGVLYCFFVIGHDRRKVLRCSVTRAPNALWIVQQMREAVQAGTSILRASPGGIVVGRPAGVSFARPRWVRSSW
jgi:putative transposase